MKVAVQVEQVQPVSIEAFGISALVRVRTDCLIQALDIFV